jgi:hypothetical protein
MAIIPSNAYSLWSDLSDIVGFFKSGGGQTNDSAMAQIQYSKHALDVEALLKKEHVTLKLHQSAICLAVGYNIKR